MDELPAPFTTLDDDVRDLDGFMLNVERLLASELNALGNCVEKWAALMLWCRAWKQIPGGSLPDDERILASFSGAGRQWPKVRAMALRGFIKCSDGRLYHRFLCDDVKRAAARKRERNDRTKAATAARMQQRDAQRDAQRDDVRNVVPGTGTKKKEEISSKPSGSRANGVNNNKKAEIRKIGDLVQGFAPPDCAPGRIAVRKREQLVSKLFRFIHDTMSPDKATEASNGLMSSDPAEAQRWLDRVDREMRATSWDDRKYGLR